MSRQLGIGLATIGLAGLLVSTLPTINLGSSSAAGLPAPAAQGGATGTSQELSGGAPDIAGEHPSAAPVYLDSSNDYGSQTTAAAPITSSQSPTDGAVRGSGSAFGPIGSPAASSRAAYDSSTSKASDFERPVAGQAQNPPAAPTATSDGGRSAFMIGSLALFVAGLLLLVVRHLVRRPNLG